MRIDKTGFYKTKAGFKTEVLTLLDDYAIGYFMNVFTGKPEARVWLRRTGACDSGPRSGVDNIVSEWREPLNWEKTMEVPKSHDGIYDTAFVDVFGQLARIPGKRVRISIEELEGGEG